MRTPSLELAQTGTEVEESTSTETRTRTAPPWNVIVHDDPITLMTYVTMVLQKTFGYSLTKAERLMMEVHTKGRSVVWTGERERAEHYTQKLQGHQLRTTCERLS